VVVLVPLALGACGGGNGTVAITDLGPRVQQASCAHEVRCGVYPDEATCEAAFSTVDFGQLQVDVAAGKTSYDGKAVADCLAVVRDQSCSITVELSTPAPAVCARAIVGTLGTGAGCYSDEECASGSCDTSACTSTSCCLGTCAAAMTTVAIGGDCSAPTASCVDGSICQAGATGGATCVAKVAAGQPCAALTECAPGTLCVNDATTGQSICGNLPTHGASCAASQFCDAATDYCNLTTGLCTSRVAAGGACPSGGECVAAAFCDATTATCKAYGKTGAACTSSGDCFANDCVGSVCVDPPPATTCP